MREEEIADNILKELGNLENINKITHCATRLRLDLKDLNKVNRENLEKIKEVKGILNSKGELQIILGSGTVQNVFSKIEEMRENRCSSLSKESNKNFNPLKILSDIFVPITPAIVAGGLLMGINNLLNSKGFFIKDMALIDLYPNIKDLADFINTLANAPFIFLPVLIGFSATKNFGGNPFLGASLGMIMIHPNLLNGYSYGEAILNEVIPYWNIMGLKIEKIGFQGTVLPILVSSYMLSKIEKNLRKIVPSFLDNLLTPLLTILISAILTFTIIGSITRDAGDFLADGLSFLYMKTNLIAGGIFGFLYAPMVITGMHHSFIAVETQLLANIVKTGGSFIFPIAAMSNIAQGAATFAVMILSKDKKTKSIASASGTSAILGITEPAMFAINLKLKYPFLAAIIASAISSAFISFNKVLAYTLGAAGLPGIVSINHESILLYIFGMFISFFISLFLTLFLAKNISFKER